MDSSPPFPLFSPKAQKLPNELIDLTIDSLAPPPDNIAVPASDVAVRTLCSCLTVSKATYHRSQELLFGRCLYIDSNWKLHALLHAYRSSHGRRGRLRRASSTSRFLAPFSGPTINEPQVLSDIQELFDLLKDSLRRLVIDMPFRSVYPDQRAGRRIRPPLRNAFCQLKALEEFTSVRDEMFLDTMTPSNPGLEPPVWSLWPKLQNLALYNVDINADFRKALNQLRNLKDLILTRPDGIEDFDNVVNSLLPSTTVHVVNTFCDHDIGHRQFMRDHTSYAPAHEAAIHSFKRPRTGTDAGAGVRLVCLDPFIPEAGRDPNCVQRCQNWVKDAGIKGTLWD